MHSSLRAQATVDTLVCGDTLTAFYDPIQGGQATDSFYVWLGNCQEVVRFDFTTADIPDGADIFYMDLAGNLTSAGSMPYFGGNCSGSNYFTNPVMFPPITTLDPLNCLPGFVEIFGRGVPMEDSMVRKLALPSDFMLSGTYQESARLHLKIPPGMVAVLFVVKYNPSAYTVLNAIWDCTPQCCIEAIGDTVCAGEDVFLNTDREAISYLWTGPNGFSSTDKSPIITSATPADEGWYVVEGHYPFGCIGMDSVYVSITAPAVSLSPGTASLCLGDSVMLSANGATSYQWTASNGSVASSNNQVWISPTDSTMVTVIGTDQQGCSDSAYAMIDLQELDMQLSAEDPICFGGQDGEIIASVLQGQAPYQIRIAGQSWQPGTSLQGLAAGTYSIEVRDVLGCMAIQSILLQDPPQMSLTPSGIDPTCHGSSDGSLSVAVNQGQGPYQIRLQGGNWQTGNSINDLGAGSYQIEIQDQAGCISNTSFTLLEPSPLQVQSQLTDPSCANTCDGSILLSASGGITPYQYRMGSVFSDSLESNFCAGNYTIEVIDAMGCQWSDAVLLNQADSISVEIHSSDPTCEDKCDAQLTLIGSGGQGPYHFFLDGNATTSTISNLCADSYLIEVQDANGCPWSQQYSIHEADPIQIDIQANDPSCAEACDAQLQFQPRTGQAPYSYFIDEQTSDLSNLQLCAASYDLRVLDAQGCSWDSTIVFTDPEVLSGSLVATPPGCDASCDGQIEIQMQGGTSPYQYTIKGAPQSGPLATGFCAGDYPVLVEDAEGCQWGSSIELQEAEPFEVMAASSPTSCLGACDGEVAIMPIGGIAPYRYRLDQGEIDSVASQLCAGTHLLEVIDANGCSFFSEVRIEEGSPFSIDLGKDQNINHGEAVQLSVSSSLPIHQITWEGICEQDCEATLTYSPEDSQPIYVQAMTEAGCEARDSLLITVYKEIDCEGNVYMPNAFSPNGDGINDQFTLYANPTAQIELIQQLMIFNKWGKVVFDRSSLRPNELSEGWDGFYAGTASPEGTYSWVASFRRSNGEVLECSGSLILIR